jgi:hypothetical protein
VIGAISVVANEPGNLSAGIGASAQTGLGRFEGRLRATLGACCHGMDAEGGRWVSSGDMWITPAFQGTYASVEALLLLLRHFFSLG